MLQKTCMKRNNLEQFEHSTFKEVLLPDNANGKAQFFFFKCVTWILMTGGYQNMLLRFQLGPCAPRIVEWDLGTSLEIWSFGLVPAG